MRRMVEDGDLGDILVVQGTYSQDWLLYDTDWNWRIVSKDNGPLRVMGDIGSHWMDMIQHVTGQPITALCADLNTFHKTRKRPKDAVETFAGKTLKPDDYEEVPIDTEDYGARAAAPGRRTRGAFTVSQVTAGCKNRLQMEIFGTKGGVSWNQERPDELWIGNRNKAQPHHLEGSVADGPKAAATPICRAGTAKATTMRTSSAYGASTPRRRREGAGGISDVRRRLSDDARARESDREFAIARVGGSGTDICRSDRIIVSGAGSPGPA